MYFFCAKGVNFSTQDDLVDGFEPLSVLRAICRRMNLSQNNFIAPLKIFRKMKYRTFKWLPICQLIVAKCPSNRLQPCFPLGMTRHRDPDWPHNAFVGQQPVPQGEPCMSCHSAPWPTLLCTCWRRLRALRGDETRACRAR